MRTKDKEIYENLRRGIWNSEYTFKLPNKYLGRPITIDPSIKPGGRTIDPSVKPPG